MRRSLTLLVIAGCATFGRAPTSTHEAARGNGPHDAAAPIPTPRFDVVPAELGDADVVSRLHARAIVRRWDHAYLVEDDPPIGRDDDDEDANDVVPVIEVGRMIRIVIEDDGARLAVWMPRDNLQPTVLAPTEIGGEIGVALRPGVPLSLPRVDGPGARLVTFADPALVVTATLPAARIGLVFVAPADDPPPTLGPPPARGWSSPDDGRPRVLVTRGTAIRARPASDATPIAHLRDQDVIATRAASRDGWIEIELHRPYVRVRGYVEADRVKPDDGRTVESTIHGHQFGVSHPTAYSLPAQTCLYDRPEGDVIGTTLAARDRIGGSVREGWGMVYVDTVWGGQKLFTKDLGDDPTSPRWETCSEDAHRR